MKGLWTSALWACLMFVVPAEAGAQQPDPVAEQKARERFDAGRAALKQNDTRGARTLFQESLEFYKTAGALINLASCEEKLGLLASASKHYEEVLVLLPDTDGRVPIAKQGLLAVRPRVPTLRVRLDKGAPRGTTVSLSGQALPTQALDTDMPLDPGSYTIIVRVTGRAPRSYEVALADGRKESIEVAPTPALQDAPRASVSAPAKSSGVPPNPLRIGGFVGLGIGAAAAIAGAVTGGLAIAKRQELGESCPTQQDCDPALRAVQADGTTFGHSSTVMFAIAGVAAAGGAALLLVAHRSKDRETKVGLAVAPGALLVRGQF